MIKCRPRMQSNTVSIIIIIIIIILIIIIIIIIIIIMSTRNKMPDLTDPTDDLQGTVGLTSSTFALSPPLPSASRKERKIRWPTRNLDCQDNS